MRKNTRKIYTLSVDELKLKCPRAFTIGMLEADYEKLKADIEQNGIKMPIVVDKATMKVMDGFHRLYIADKLGIAEVKAVYVNARFLSPSKLKEVIRDLEGSFNPKPKKKPFVRVAMQSRKDFVDN